MGNFWIGKSIRLAMLALAVSLVAATQVSAQDDDLANELGGAAPAPAAAPVDNAAANNAPANNAATPDAPKPPSNYLSWTFKSLGPSYTVVFLAISIMLLTLIVMNILSARQDNICPADLVEGVEQQLAEGNTQGAAEIVRSDDSLLGQVLSAGLSKLDKGHSYAIEAMQEVGEEETMKIEHSLNYMALIGNISPMIGLLGTVQGMIASFQVIANSGTTPKPSELAAGISTALFTTLVGLLIAIPAIAIFNILRSRIQRLTLQVGIASEDLLERFQAS
jgi:biopolymer transport protein ExbB